MPDRMAPLMALIDVLPEETAEAVLIQLLSGLVDPDQS
jgi:hypothetical protein